MPRRLIPAVLALLPPVLLAGTATAGLETSADQDITDQSVLTSSDVPLGFEAFADADGDDVQRGAKCKVVTRASKQLNRAPNTEASFAQGRTALINNQVSVFETPKEAKAAYAAYAGKKAPACFERGFEESYAAQLDDPEAEVQVTLDRYGPDLGDAAVGYELQIDLSAGGQQQTLFANLEVVRVGRAIDAFAFINSGEALSSDDIVAMTDAGVGRLEASL
jgi:hypothetical protein